MFRCLPGFKAKYHYLNMVIAADFDEWKVIIEGDGVTINAGRQFTEAKAKEAARAGAASYIHAEKHESLPVIDTVQWQPLGTGEFLNWRP